MSDSIHRSLIALFAIITSCSVAAACLWDRDTRTMEEQQFPDTLALITGGFLRHSPEFYQWRIDRRLNEIEQDPDNLELYDDLAVAYDKTGQTEKAIEVMQKIESRDPDRYETLANLGTFYIHNKELERGLEYIEKAIEINPDAHFGRERYQKYLVEYLLSINPDVEQVKFPLDDSDRFYGRTEPFGFAAFLFKRLKEEELEGKTSEHWKRKEIEQAVKGVLGMMRFGHHDSPILLECLGDLLFAGQDRENATQLAARAYLKASYQTEENAAKTAYRNFASSCAWSIYDPDQFPVGSLGLEKLEQQFSTELEAADQWVSAVFADEQRWIRNGDDVEEMYHLTYYYDPVAAPDPHYDLESVRQAARRKLWIMIASPVVGTLLIVALWIRLRRKRTPKVSETQVRP